jgi:hypothetical protein
MPKNPFTLIILFILFPLAVGLACLSSRAEPTATSEPIVVTVVVKEEVIVTATPESTATAVQEEQVPEEEQEEEEEEQVLPQTMDLVLLDNSLWVQDGTAVFAAYLFENPFGDVLFEDIEFTITLFAANGDVIDTDYTIIPWFFPNQIQSVVFNFWVADESVVVDSVEVDWTFTGTSSPDDFVNPFTSDQLVYWDNDGYPIVTGKVINNEATTFTDIRINILCYDSAGKIVGGGVNYLDFIHLNDYMGFTAYVDVFGDVASVEAFPTLSYMTEFIDKTDFTSEISIQDDFFYEDQYGYLMGGFIANNETDTVLRNSEIYITFYNEEENITTTGYTYVDLLLPGASIGISPWISTTPEGTTSARYDILILPGEVLDDYELDTNPFTVNSTTLTGDYDNYVLVNFTNTYSKQVSEVDVFVLVYNADGEIIGGGKDWTDEPTPAGGSDEVEVWVSYASSETVDSIEAWVVPSYWTEFE